MDLNMNKLSISNVDGTDWRGKTALHWATLNNEISLIEQLLSQGADVNARDKENKTPLHLAAENEVKNNKTFFEVAKTLLKNGADANARDNDGLTPLSYFVIGGDLKSLELFLNFKADVHVIDNGGENLLFPAVCNTKNTIIVQLLLDLGLDVNHRCKEGQTPLHYACLDFDDLEMIKCLLKNGADINAANHKGFTPLIEAADRIVNHLYRNKQKLYFLLEHADFNNEVHDNILFLYPGQILKHFAKLQILNIPVHPSLVNKLLSKRKYSEFYEQCKEELSRAKSTKLMNSWITLYDILVGSRKKLKNYAVIKDLITDISSYVYLGNEFSIYGKSMYKNAKRGILRRKLFDRSCIMLSNCLPILNSDHLIIRDIFDCILSKKDLSKFCELNFNIDKTICM